LLGAWAGVETTACRFSKSKVKFRLAPDDVSARLTGYVHNAVSPVALADPSVPLVLSHHIAALQPDFFWLGGGEADLKLGFSCREFVQVRQRLMCGLCVRRTVQANGVTYARTAPSYATECSGRTV
jgi:hypothetical protein